MPTFAFPDAPAKLTLCLRSVWNALLPQPPSYSPEGGRMAIHSFGSMLDARLLSAPNGSTSELLRTL